jgi:hypothetical protein
MVTVPPATPIVACVEAALLSPSSDEQAARAQGIKNGLKMVNLMPPARSKFDASAAARDLRRLPGKRLSDC